jgi:hypothetical protein
MSLSLVQKLKQFEKQIVFLRWSSCGEYGKIKYVGYDFVEFEVLDIKTMEYDETVLINPQVILEMVIGGYDISRIIAEYSSKLSTE